MTLPQKRIVIGDNDDNKSGQKLLKLGHYSYLVPKPYKDLGDMPQNEVKEFIDGIIRVI